MAKPVPVEIRVADLPQMQRFISAVAGLLLVVDQCAPAVPVSVLEAADLARQAAAALVRPAT